MLSIYTYPDTVLKKVAKPVEQVDDKIAELLEQMAHTMYEADGVGLAAPQVGVSLRMLVMDIAQADEEVEPEEGEPEEGEPQERRRELIQVVNPEIIQAEGKIIWEEGCLSLPGIVANVERHAKVVVRALNEKGEPVEFQAEGLGAVAFQHEIDHLDGVLFIDRVGRLRRRGLLKEYQKHVKEKFCES